MTATVSPESVTTTTNTVDAFVETISEHEQTLHFGDQPGTPLLLASQCIGESCQNIAVGQDVKTARSSLKQARALLAPLVHPSSPLDRHRSKALLLDMVARMIQHRRNNTVITNIRDELLHEAGAQISRVIHKVGDTPRKRIALGDITEMTALCALARITDPRFLTVPALPHHEGGPAETKHRHFDLVLSITDNNRTYGHKLQVKRSCLAFCADSARRARKYRSEVRKQYSSDVTLISGCCDLGIKYTGQSVYDLTTSERLAREVNGGVSNLEINKLNDTTNHLLLDIIGNEERRGTLPP